MKLKATPDSNKNSILDIPTKIGDEFFVFYQNRVMIYERGTDCEYLSPSLIPSPIKTDWYIKFRGEPIGQYNGSTLYAHHPIKWCDGVGCEGCKEEGT